jgi:hypothetical protein
LNSNGFRDPKKHKFVSDLTKENDLSFIGILESGKTDFMPRFFKNLSGGRDFLWHSKDPHGRSGGILLGVDQQMFAIGLIDEGIFMLNFSYVISWTSLSGQWLWCMGRQNLLTKKAFFQSWCICVAMKIFHLLWVVIITFYDIHLRKITPIKR